MNEDTVKGNWKQFTGKIKEQWGKLTDDDLDVAAGKRDQFLGKLQERQGLAKDAAEKELKSWQDRHPEFRFDK
ncbi:CsbD family protein [Acidovorax sp. SUPP950]|uniref:CsbD family protein n=1 Tax=unclassified Acidovorax TaxID=2684926 RepID=UPI00234BBF53|nr:MULTISPECIES: CsbD family protein [Comamonadaceae]WCM97486.1 CsbD family protein [Acidovorax sp. GBBC 1281]WOI46590.1 CsbD family protein [Paracidovorax avenae]GKS75975.1 CsbD family protein [Acidovorax sp. SUPP950]GKS87156.1 CsbD family protein [Acidovorax sp. SUPP1855]GKS89915.1 CsbD family protein [Acidovorax sp. SUPP2539]